MAINFFYYDAESVTLPSSLPYAGIFIPIASLPGIIKEDLHNAISNNTKQSKVVYSLIQRFDSFLRATTNKLGISSSISNPSVVNPTTITYNFTFTVEFLVNNSTGRVKMVPVPNVGVYSGIGKFSLIDVFPNTLVIRDPESESGLIDGAGPGVLIDVSTLEEYGFFNDVYNSTIATYNHSGDCRYSLVALVAAICDGNIQVRSTTAPSGIISASVSDAEVIPIPTSYYSTTNPMTSITSYNLDHQSIIRRTYGLGFELNLLPEYLNVSVKTS